jgi:predicted enzyme related to lactoylglutathione lyase
VNFNSILIGSDNPDRLVEYYNRLFGEGLGDGGYYGWQIGSGNITVGPHSDVHGRNEAPGRILINIESDDVRGDFERFKAAGAIVVVEPYSFDEWPDSWIATFADPDNNYFQLMTPMPEEMQQQMKERRAAGVS